MPRVATLQDSDNACTMNIRALHKRGNKKLSEVYRRHFLFAPQERCFQHVLRGAAVPWEQQPVAAQRACRCGHALILVLVYMSRSS